ncbi:MAG: hypothetical protein ACLUOF_05590 [Ruminococcus sp.]
MPASSAPATRACCRRAERSSPAFSIGCGSSPCFPTPPSTPTSGSDCGCPQPHQLVRGEPHSLIQLLYAPGDGSIEFRSADPYCNPYITFQMLLSAGMAGIQNGEELTDTMNAANASSVFPTLPSSLEESIRLAQNSSFVHAVLPETLIRITPLPWNSRLLHTMWRRILRRSASTAISDARFTENRL